MIVWQRSHEVLSRQSSQIAIRLRDEFTGEAPIGRLRVTLEAEDAGGEWHDTARRAIVTTRHIVTFPGLEQRARAVGLPARKYRVLIAADYYFPLYPSAASPGVEVAVQPFDDDHPPPLPSAPTELLLLPAPTYPFPSHVRVLRGRVRVQGTNDYVTGAFVREGTRERVLTDEQGAFALPLRWPADETIALPVDADDRVSKVGSILVDLPAALGHAQTIDIH